MVTNVPPCAASYLKGGREGCVCGEDKKGWGISRMCVYSIQLAPGIRAHVTRPYLHLQ